MIGPNSLFGFWSATTQQHFDFTGSMMLPTVDIQLGADVGRNAVAQLAITAARNLGGPDPVTGMNGIVVIPFPGVRQIPNPDNSPGAPPTVPQGLDGGATSIGGIGVAVVPVTADFTFLSHEVGHVLGFVHTFGLLNNGTDWNGSADPVIEGNEYGSPYDLMSSATFGGRWEGRRPTTTRHPPSSSRRSPAGPAHDRRDRTSAARSCITQNRARPQAACSTGHIRLPAPLCSNGYGRPTKTTCHGFSCSTHRTSRRTESGVSTSNTERRWDGTPDSGSPDHNSTASAPWCTP